MKRASAFPRHESWPWAGAPHAAPLVARDAVPGLQLISETLHMPFDMLRSQHAHAVHAGLLANSMLESRDFECSVDALEHFTLGPFARQV
jgi:hypothetical protein